MNHWTTLEELRAGAVFETRSGVLAIKSEYHYSDEMAVMCVLLGSGEFAHFGRTPEEHNATAVREVAGIVRRI